MAIRRRAHSSGDTSAGVVGRIARRRRGVSTTSVHHTLEQETPVLDLLQSAPVKVEHFRRGEYLHVSDVVSQCLRKFVLLQRLGMEMPAKSLWDGTAGILFSTGSAVHDYVVQKLADAHPARVYARWECRCGTVSMEGTKTQVARKTGQCEVCGEFATVCKEYRVVSDALRVTGSIDLLLWLNEYKAFLPTEIKSLSKTRFTENVRAEPDHIVQVLFYWYLLREKGLPLVDHVSLLYVCRDYLRGLPYKEYKLTVSDALHLIDPYLESLRLYAAAADDDSVALPPRSCPQIDCATAKTCPVAVTCFGAGA